MMILFGLSVEMIELPRLPVNFVRNITPPIRGIHQFVADSGPQQRVASSCRPHGLTMDLEWYGLKPADTGQFYKFWRDIGLDSATGVSLTAFYIPKNHPMWEKVPTWRYIEQYLLSSESIDNAKWLLTSPSAVDAEVINIDRWSCKIQETYG